MINNFTEEQKNKYENFFKFYTNETIDFFSKVFEDKFKESEQKDFYIAYKNIIKKTAKLINELGITDPFHASVIFEYLLWNGFLSKDKTLVYDITNRKNNIALTGADIMRGNSVCLNNSDMLTSVLNQMDIRSYILGCSVKPTKETLKYKPNIERNIKQPTFKDKIIQKLGTLPPLKYLGNHAITMFEYNGVYYISDPTSLAFLNFNDFMKAKYVGSDLEVTIKPWISLCLQSIPKDKFKEIITKTLIQSNTQLLNLDLIKEFSENALEICQENSNLLDDFHTDNVNDIDIICKTLTR